MKNKYFEDLNQFHKEFYNKTENVLTSVDLLINGIKATEENLCSCSSLKPVGNVPHKSNAQIYRIYKLMSWPLLR